MKRADLYTVIHKAQRAHMFALGTKIGKTDFSDARAAEDVARELKAFIQHIREHGQNEDNFIHPMFRELGDHAVDALDEEHHDLDKELDKLEKVVDNKDWEKLYPEFNRFIATYLMHQDEEEGLQESVLWKHFDDDRLIKAFMEFQASRSPSQNVEDLKFILPGLSIPELAPIFQGIKAANPQGFQGACKMAEMAMEPSRFAELCKVI